MRSLIPLVILISFINLVGCSSVFYYPTRHLHHDPRKIQLAPQEIEIPSTNGNKIFAWYFQNIKKQDPRAIVVFYHGNGENISSHYLSLTWLLAHPYDFIIFDYQGYGRSQGSPSQKNTIEDGKAALQWVHQKYPEKPIVILGQSLGGAIALRNAIDLRDNLPIRMVVVDSTFASYRSMARKVLSRSILSWPLQWLGWLLVSDTYAPKGEIQKISPIPLVVIHGDRDTVVEYEMGEEVFNQAHSPKEFWQVPEGNHIDSFVREDVNIRQRFLQKLAELFPEKK